MPSQNDFQKVKTNFLDPLLKHFSKKLNDEQGEAYVEDLSEFSSDVLQRAWLHCRRSNKYFPSIYEAISACDELRKSTGKPKSSNPSGHREKWDIRDEDRKNLVHDFLYENLMKTALYRQAQAEYWDIPLRRYAMALANLQAQMIYPSPAGHYAYEGSILEINHNMPGWKDFLEQQRIACANGAISFSVPSELIDRWKFSANVMQAYRERKAA